MKKVRIAFLAATVLTLSGCVPHTELDKLAIAEMVGIDRDADGCTVTLQYFNTDASGGVTAVDSSSPNAVTAKGRGKTVEAALEAVSYTSGKEVMLGAAEMIVFGSGAADRLHDRLSFAASHYTGNPRCYVTFTDGNAADILNVKFTEGNASVDKLEGMMKNAEALGLCRTLRLYEAMEMLSEPTESLVMPMMTLYEANSDYTENGKSITFTGGALCTGGRFADKLTVSEMSGVHLLTTRGGTCEMTFAIGSEDARVMLYGISAKVTPGLSEGTLTLRFDLSADCKYVGTSLTDPYRSRDKLRELCEQEMTARATSALSKALTTYGADIFGLSYKIRAHSPALWQQIEGEYRDKLKAADIEVQTRVSIERFGTVHG